MSIVCVFGGTGFLGRSIMRRLGAQGATVRIAVRSPDRVRKVFHGSERDRIEAVRADVRERASVAAAVAGADAVVNAVSAYVEKNGITFKAVHVRGARTVAEEAAAAGVGRLVLVSGIGADADAPAPYIRARGRGERAVREAIPGATVIRPSAMFGPGDALFGTLADIVRLSPVLPLIGARTRLQPVFVDDVAEAIARLLERPDSAGNTYELGGPRVYTLRELAELTLRLLDRRRLLLPVPFVIADIQARLLELLPHPPLTTGQVDLLRADNVASGALPGLRELGIRPKSVEDTVPDYLSRTR
jgi:NADH dehydrogenase